MHVITYHRAIAQNIRAESLLNCADWNSDRCQDPMSTDKAEDVKRFALQALWLRKVAAEVQQHEDAVAASLAA